jgi:hypothetical protein
MGRAADPECGVQAVIASQYSARAFAAFAEFVH